jgi:hypothetical protein
MAGIKTTEPSTEVRPESSAGVKEADKAQMHDRADKDDRMGAPIRPESVPASQKEASHA